MTSLPGMKKNNMAAKYILLEFKFSFINKRWTFTSANKQSSWKSILQKSQEKVSFSILICNIGQFTQLLNFWLSFRSFLLWKRNNNYSRMIQCKDFQKKKQRKLTNLWRKMYFKNERKYSKRSDQVTDDVESLFWSWEKLSGGTLVSCKFSLPCDETSIIYSPRPSLPTFSLMFFTPLNFKCRT